MIVETFLPGAEFTCGVLGNGASARVLPLVGMNFGSLPDGRAPDLRLRSEVDLGRAERIRSTSSSARRASTRALQLAIEDVVLRAYRVLGCRDWSRIDVRLDAAGVPNIVEVNPLPGILPNPADNSCLPKAARAAGSELRRAHSVRAAPRGGARRRSTRPTAPTPTRRPSYRGRMKVAILFDGASAYATNPDQLILGTVEAIEQSLVAEGNEVGYVPVYQDGKWIEKLRRGKFDLAFNMCEGIDGIAALESAVISRARAVQDSVHRRVELHAPPSACASTSSTRCSRRPGFPCRASPRCGAAIRS